MRAERLALHRALLLPLLEVSKCLRPGWVLHPLHYLELSDKVDIIVGGEYVVHPAVQHFCETLIGDEPGRVERKTDGRLVTAVVTFEVVLEQAAELVLVVNVGAGGDQVAAGQVLVKVRIVSAVQLVDGELPDGMGAAGAVTSVPMALVGHPVVESVGPERPPPQRGADAGVEG